MKDFFLALVSYVKRHISVIAAAFITAAVFCAVFSLYNLPTEAVLYSIVLAVAALCILGAFRFWGFYQKHKILSEMAEKITFSALELPKPSSIIEKDYQQLLEILAESRMKMASEFDSSHTETVDYYTLWAHQIKTPIAAMRLLLQSGDENDSEEMLEQLFKIEQYVEMVMQFLRIDSMSSDLIIKKQPLDDIVRQAVRKYSKLFIRKKISLDYKPLNCEVLTDEKWLTFVIEQVLSNSLKYTLKGGISVYMDERLPKTLVIEDTGIGIRSEDLPRVFEKGFTGYNGHADKKSTGIGLFLCKRILTKLSHTIAIESTVGVGTRVKIGLDTVNDAND